MSKTPWFKFYGDDFYMDTIDLSDEEVGAYIRLLIRQWRAEMKGDQLPLKQGEEHRTWETISHYFEMRTQCERNANALGENDANAMRTHTKTDANAMRTQCEGSTIKYAISNRRMREIVLESLSKSAANRKSAEKRWKNSDYSENPSIANAMRTQCERNAKLEARNKNVSLENIPITPSLEEEDPDPGDTREGHSLAQFHASWRLRIDKGFGRHMQDFLMRWGPWYQSKINTKDIDPEKVKKTLLHWERVRYWRDKLLTPQSLLDESGGVSWLDKAFIAIEEDPKGAKPAVSRYHEKSYDEVAADLGF